MQVLGVLDGQPVGLPCHVTTGKRIITTLTVSDENTRHKMGFPGR